MNQSKNNSTVRAEEAFLLHLIDITWNTVTESHEVPDPDWSRQIIEKARESFPKSIWFSSFASQPQECYVKVSVEDELPPERKNVHLIVESTFVDGHFYPLSGFYTKGGEVDFEDYDDDFPGCFDEERGNSYLPKGFWHESGDEEKFFEVKKVTYWLKKQSNPLPVLTDAEIEERAEEIAREWDVYYYESGEINNSVISALKAALNPKQNEKELNNEK